MIEPIRILHVVGSLGIGGIQTYLVELYRHVNREKVQFDFVVNIKTENEKNYEHEVRQLGGKIYYVDEDVFEKKNLIKYVRFWEFFFKEHPEYKIVHGHLRTSSVIYLYEAKKAGCYTIAHSHATSNGLGTSAKVKDLLQLPTRYIADFCMGCSQDANEWMFGRKRANGKTCIVLHNGIDIEKFRFNENLRTKKRMELGLHNENFVIGCVGRLVDPKNQKLVIDAMPKVLEKIPMAVCLLIGDGPLHNNLQVQCKNLSLGANKIKMLGSRMDVYELLNAMDLFVLPSRFEGLGIAAIEAQANGLPVLVSKAFPKEVFVSDRIYKVSGGAIDWAEKIVSCRSLNLNRKQKMLEGSNYDIKEIAKKLTEFYLEVIKRFS